MLPPKRKDAAISVGHFSLVVANAGEAWMSSRRVSASSRGLEVLRIFSGDRFEVRCRQLRKGLRPGVKVLITEPLYAKTFPSQPSPSTRHAPRLANSSSWISLRFALRTTCGGASWKSVAAYLAASDCRCTRKRWCCCSRAVTRNRTVRRQRRWQKVRGFRGINSLKERPIDATQCVH
jgi:hypothetical protein